MTDRERDPDGPVDRPSAWLPPPSGPAAPLRAGWTPPGQPPVLPPQTQWPPGGVGLGGGPWPTRPVARHRRAGCLLAVAVPVVWLILLVALALHDPTSTTRSSLPPPSGPSRLPAREAQTAWSITPGQLRTDVTDPQFVASIDGDFQGGYVAGVAGLWLTITGRESGSDTVLHAIDPDTGTSRWQRSLDGVLCTTEAPTSGLLCASVLDRDRATGLGTRWRLHLIDPTTGGDRLTRDIEGWLTAVHRADRAFVLLEQREPAPHAVVRAFATDDLQPLWDRDLAGEPGQAEMFSDNRIIRRTEPERPTLALDRPRLRDVGDGLIAVWAGQRTAFIDRDRGTLVMMPHCSRLVDDSERLWCNETDGATAYSYEGKKLHRIRGPRLAFPEDDGVGIDRNRPVFIDAVGAAVSVDRATGTVGKAYTPPGSGSAFGQVTMPGAATVGDHTFLIGKAGAMLLDPDRGRTRWTNPDTTVSELPILVGDRVLLGSFTLDAVDLGTGRTTERIRVDATYAVAVGPRIAGTGQDQLSLIRLG